MRSHRGDDPEKLGGKKMVRSHDKNRLVVANIGWAETIPDWLMREVESERIVEGIMGLVDKGNDEMVGLAEVCVYLYTEALTHPVDRDRTQIYLWVTGKVMEKVKGEIPDFVKEVLDKGLNSDEARELGELRRTLYRKRGGAIRTPLFDALKALKKEIKKGG